MYVLLHQVAWLYAQTYRSELRCFRVVYPVRLMTF